MAAVIEVKYFNTFLLKKVNKAQITPSPGYGNIPVWNGSMGIPQAKGGYPRPGANVEKDWVIEESRINGGYNNTSVSFGAKAYLVEEEPNGTRRGNSLIYSGIFNSRTGINNTNVFSVADNIIKSVSPANGSIQKLHAENTNLTIFQELKVSRALIDKDAIYSAEGGGTVTSSNLVIGAIQPFIGKYGISTDPTSFAIYGQDKYFSDRNNNVIMKLSGSGLSEISSANMIDYFRDTLGSLTVAGVQGKIIGGYDIYNKQYVVSTQDPNNDVISPPAQAGYNTLVYDELVKGWTSFFSYKPDQMFSLGNQFYSLNLGKLYQHYSPSGTRNVFYNTTAVATSITFIFNPNVGSSKNFKTVSYEGTSGWQINSFVSDTTGRNLNFSNSNWINNEDTVAFIYSYVEGRYDSTTPNPLTGTAVVVRPFYQGGFDRKENLYVSNLINNSSAGPGEITFGTSMAGIKGFYATVTISTDTITNPGGEKELFAVSSEYIANNGY
tara:strand:+ start:7158 stop:8642 length:1485 start_codon:yes stop_codon:yes gene_type:complete